MLLAFMSPDKPGRCIIAWEWAPNFITKDALWLRSLEGELADKYQGVEGVSMEDIHDTLVDLVVERFPMKGLREYLQAMKQVEPELPDAAEEENKKSEC